MKSKCCFCNDAHDVYEVLFTYDNICGARCTFEDWYYIYCKDHMKYWELSDRNKEDIDKIMWQLKYYHQEKYPDQNIDIPKIEIIHTSAGHVYYKLQFKE